MQVIEKKTSPLQKYLNRFDLHIVETLKTNFIDSKRDHFYHFNRRQMLKRPAMSAKGAMR